MYKRWVESYQHMTENYESKSYSQEQTKQDLKV